MVMMAAVFMLRIGYVAESCRKLVVLDLMEARCSVEAVKYAITRLPPAYRR